VKRSLPFVLACVVALMAPISPAADSALKKLFTVKLKITETKDGQTRTIAEPVLIVRAGEEASFATGEVASADDTAAAVGLQAKMTVSESDDHKLRVVMSVFNNELKDGNKSDFTIVQSGARCVKTIQRGEANTFDMGEGRQATLVVYANASN
jgi:hypothetical protein